MNASRPETVVLGGGCYGLAVAQVLGAVSVQDRWLRDQWWGAKTSFAKPLLRCRHVFQVASGAESPTRAEWRHDAFWRLYGRLGGDMKTATGLRWLLLDCRPCGTGCDNWPSAFCSRVPASQGLRAILSSCRDAPEHRYHDWHDAHVVGQEVAMREKIFRLVLDDPRTEASAVKAGELAAKIRPLAWERFCPPPDDHALAKSIRAWLRCPVTDPVTLWFSEGESLLRQTTLNQ